MQLKQDRDSPPEVRIAELSASVSRTCCSAQANQIPQAQQRAIAQHSHSLWKQKGSTERTSVLLSFQAGNETHSPAGSDTGNSLG